MEEMAGNIAYSFHFPPSEIMSMDIDDLIFWSKQAVRINKEIDRRSKRK